MSPPGDRRRQASQRFVELAREAELDVDAILEVAAQMGLIERARGGSGTCCAPSR